MDTAAVLLTVGPKHPPSCADPKRFGPRLYVTASRREVPLYGRNEEVLNGQLRVKLSFPTTLLLLHKTRAHAGAKESLLWLQQPEQPMHHRAGSGYSARV